MSDRLELSVDVVSDVICPWCHLGGMRLDAAIAASGIDVTVRWRPYQLDPSIPAGGLDRGSYMRAKFPDQARLEEAHRRLRALGLEEGIRFDFEAITKTPNTLDAHRVIRWAGAAGPQAQGSLVRRLFRLYFEEGRDVGDRAVLAQAADEAGLEATIVEALLASGADEDAVKDEIATAGRMGITGVPCFLLDGRYAIVGAQDSDALAAAIAQVAGAKARGELDAEAL